MLDAADGVLDGSAGCPVVSIINDVPDPVALAQVFADPNCFSFQEIFPGGFTPPFGGDVKDGSLVVGVQRRDRRRASPGTRARVATARSSSSSTTP